MYKILLFTCCLAYSFAIESNFYREEPCAEMGGYCVLEKECPNKLTKEYAHLCSGQRGLGAICCKNFPASDVNCYQLHNDCKPQCPKSLNVGRKGCPADQSCCALV